MFIEIARRAQFSEEKLDRMHQLRARTFKERKKWEVFVVDNKEVDEYDALNPYYLLISRKTGNEVIGCWRILDTLGPYMLRNTFPELLHGLPAPQDPRILELSRFIVCAGQAGNTTFSNITLQAIREMVRFAMRRGVRQLVTVTTVGVERMLRKTGMSMQSFGPAMRVGIEQAVALAIHLDEQTDRALFGEASQAPGPFSDECSGPLAVHACQSVGQLPRLRQAG